MHSRCDRCFDYGNAEPYRGDFEPVRRDLDDLLPPPGGGAAG